MTIGTPGGSVERPALFFADAAQWRAWLAANHATEPGLWMGLRKKHVADRGLVWQDAVREALCFGWIDSQVQRIDDDAVRQRWTPRKPGSTWSAVNVAAVQELTEQGRMMPSGLAAYESRRPERTGIYAYEQGEVHLPPEYLAELASNPIAQQWWDGATDSYRKICVHWVVSAKQATTRDRRMQALIDDCAHGRLIPSQRYGREPAWVARLHGALDLRPDAAP